MTTFLEARAEEATSLPAFAMNYPEFRRSVQAIQDQFGTTGTFAEYTRHDASHLSGVMEIADWLIPNSTKAILTPAECFFIVISILLHDVGLVVTKDEFASRSKTDFPRFCKSDDARQLAIGLSGNDRETKLYEEFVRRHHGARARKWIEGAADDAFGATDAVRSELSRLFSSLDSEVRLDLARLAESHTLDQLSDRDLFPVNKPYGAAAETANLLFCAVILRSADLLDVTGSRAPAIIHRMKRPQDPISDVEWAKQIPVQSIRAKDPLDKDGKIDRNSESDTIEVFARFKDPNGYFALTDYLTYAESEISRSARLISDASGATRREFSFPWRSISVDHVKADGFIPRTFKFEIDQKRILELLTGHTLYNDSSVALRELVQNAIDASRLRAHGLKRDSRDFARVKVKWNSASRTLEVRDNGTGMTQNEIEEHLLKVGSSKYQSDDFRKMYKDFTSISRFGIGVLSAFMIADYVDVITVSDNEPEARKVSLKNVHGKYLISTFPKQDARAEGLSPSGTVVRLIVRQDVQRLHVLEALKRWIVCPEARVFVVVDEEKEIEVGYDSPKAALEDYIASNSSFSVEGITEVREVSSGALKLAYATTYDPTFREWSLSPSRIRDERSWASSHVGTCISGIAVEFTSPGFRNQEILALANLSGPDAPRTNVARTALEDTEELRRAVGEVYVALAGHVITESKRLQEEESYSLTRATAEAGYLLTTLSRQIPFAIGSEALGSSLARVPIFLGEDLAGRKALSERELRQERVFWTVESSVVRTVEHLVQEAPAALTLRKLLLLAQPDASALPTELIITNLTQESMTRRIAEEYFEIDTFALDYTGRRLDARWSEKAVDPIWINSQFISSKLAHNARARNQALYNELGTRRGAKTYVARREISLPGLDEYGSVQYFGTYILRACTLTPLLDQLILDPADENAMFSALCYLDVLNVATGFSSQSDAATPWIENRLKRFESVSPHAQLVRRDEFIQALIGYLGKLKPFNPHAWSRLVVGSVDAD